MDQKSDEPTGSTDWNGQLLASALRNSCMSGMECRREELHSFTGCSQRPPLDLSRSGNEWRF